jgi:DNA repair photolyase
VLRDLDILKRLAARNLVRVCISITTLDAKLARIMEPRAATPARRLQAARELSTEGVPVAVLAAPMIPGVNDAELERIIEAASEAGARSAGYVLLRLPHELRQLFEEWLHRHYPDRAARVLALIRQTRGGRLYDADFERRQTGEGPYAEMLAKRFDVAMRRHGLARRSEELERLSTEAFDGRSDERQPRLL